MGWKNLKEHFKIEHIVQVTQKGICIGSGYVHDLATIDPTTGTVRENPTFRDFLREHYPALLESEPAEIARLINAPDSFSASITVYTYDGGNIIEKQCEALGWPNVTHDGEVMYENQFSADLATVVAWAKRSADLGIRYGEESVEEIKQQLADCCSRLEGERVNRAKLEAQYPTEAPNV